jgi:hypothetical protein
MKWLSDILTDDGGNFTPDKVGLAVGITGWIAGLFSFLRLAWVAVYLKGQPFDPVAYGSGFALIIGSLGVVLGLGGTAMWLSSRQKPRAFNDKRGSSDGFRGLRQDRVA